jgi:hypothetical protein
MPHYDTLSPLQVDMLISEADKDGNGILDYEEFVQVSQRRLFSASEKSPFPRVSFQLMTSK